MKIRDSTVIFASTLVTFSSVALLVYHITLSDVKCRKRHLDRRQKKLEELTQEGEGPTGRKPVSTDEICPPLEELGQMACYEEGEIESVSNSLIFRELAKNPTALKRLSMMLSGDCLKDREFATDLLMYYLHKVQASRMFLGTYPVLYGLVLGLDKSLDCLKEVDSQKDPVGFSRNLAVFINIISLMCLFCERSKHQMPAHQLCLYGIVDVFRKWNRIVPRDDDREWKPGMIPSILDVHDKASQFPYTYNIVQDVMMADYQMESTIDGLLDDMFTGVRLSKIHMLSMVVKNSLDLVHEYGEGGIRVDKDMELSDLSCRPFQDFIVSFRNQEYDKIRRDAEVTEFFYYGNHDTSLSSSEASIDTGDELWDHQGGDEEDEEDEAEYDEDESEDGEEYDENEDGEHSNGDDSDDQYYGSEYENDMYDGLDDEEAMALREIYDGLNEEEAAALREYLDDGYQYNDLNDTYEGYDLSDGDYRLVR